MSAARQVKIKTGVVKRTFKELKGYEQEAKKQEAKIQKMIEDGSGEHDIRKQKEVLEESLQMIPDCEKRYKIAYDELACLIKDLTEGEELSQAQKILSECIV